jgi:quercetin dioxygenase-like cupin family protein
MPELPVPASVPSLVEEHLATARRASSGRSAATLYGGQQHRLRQTLVALTAGRRLDEHENPGEATLQVLAGRVRLTAGAAAAEAVAGDLLVIPDDRHALEALEDCAVLLTIAMR